MQRFLYPELSNRLVFRAPLSSELVQFCGGLALHGGPIRAKYKRPRNSSAQCFGTVTFGHESSRTISLHDLRDNAMALGHKWSASGIDRRQTV